MDETQQAAPEPVVVLYCGVCQLPVEYCEFAPKPDECRAWLLKNHPELCADVSSLSISSQSPQQATTPAEGEEGASTAVVTTATEDGDVVVDADEEVAAEQPKKKKSSKSSKTDLVTIQVQTRSKRKCVTVVTGLEPYGIKLKEAAKLFANAFACGASVVATPSQTQEIDIQGDFREQVEELLKSKFPQIPAEKIKFVEEKKKQQS
eukprot:c6805_g1_i2.p1 GENE.c6805_g1_i2~~c6805_g1_i2.p1  ORF type:complete len:206 (-),score=68.09 c6805_g1_i2:80-697(-)